MSKAATTKRTPKRRLIDCDVGDVAETPCGWLLVTGEPIGGCPLVRLWHPSELRYVTSAFGAPADLVVLSVARKPTLPPAAGGDEFDPVRG